MMLGGMYSVDRTLLGSGGPPASKVARERVTGTMRRVVVVSEKKKR